MVLYPAILNIHGGQERAAGSRYRTGRVLLASLGCAFSVNCQAKPAAEYAGRGWKGKSPVCTRTAELCSRRVMTTTSLVTRRLHECGVRLAYILQSLDMHDRVWTYDSDKSRLSAMTHKANRCAHSYKIAQDPELACTLL